MVNRLTDSEASELLKTLFKVEYAFPSFSQQEKMAILQVLDLILYADNMADKKELKWMDLVITQFGLTWEYLHIAIKQDAKNNMLILRAMNQQKKLIFKEIVLNMAKIDGSIAIQEKVIYEAIFEIVGI